MNSDELPKLKSEVSEAESLLQEEIETSLPKQQRSVDPEDARLKKLHQLLKKESDFFMELSHGVGDLSGGLSALPNSVQVSPGIETGSVILQGMLGFIGLFQSVSQFLDGEKISLSRTAKMMYAAGSIILMALSFAFPPLALIFGAIIASVGFVMSAHALGTYLYSVFKVADLSQRCNKLLSDIKEERDKDVTQLRSLNDTWSSLSLQERGTLLTELEAHVKNRDTMIQDLSKIKQSLQADDSKLNQVAPYRGVAVFLASVALTAAILSFVLPPVGAVLMLVSFSLACAWLAVSVGIYTKHAWNQKQGDVTAAGNQENSISQVPTESLSIENRLEKNICVEDEVSSEIKLHDPSVLLRDIPASSHVASPPPPGTPPESEEMSQKAPEAPEVAKAENGEDETEGEGAGSKPKP